MRIVGPILGILAGVAVLGGIIWCSRYAPWVPQPPNPRIANVGLSEPVSVRMKREAEAKAKEQQEQGGASGPSVQEPGCPGPGHQGPFSQSSLVGETISRSSATLEVLQEGKHRFRIDGTKGKVRCHCCSSPRRPGLPGSVKSRRASRPSSRNELAIVRAGCQFLQDGDRSGRSDPKLPWRCS